MTESPPTRILRRPAVEARVQLSRGTIYNLLRRREFPQPIRLGPRSVGWLEHEVDAWLADRSLERHAAASRTGSDNGGAQ